MWKSWLSRWAKGKGAQAKRTTPPARRTPLLIEALEERQLLS